MSNQIHKSIIVSIIIPIYRHSGLLIEAIESALSQECQFHYNIILVNDGCPFKGTHKICKAYADLYGDKVTYLRKKNGGLSSARNHGVSFALKNYPNLRAFYFLDADNRISPHLLKNSVNLLDERNNIGWVYPNIDMFGQRWSLDYGGIYSQLIHSKMNICEAGSLVSKNIFESGVYFDETFQLGWEDWDFFLSASEKGFKGINCENMGFEYRKRPESMLSNSNRHRTVIHHQIQKKHHNLYNLSKIIDLEHTDSPRYANIDIEKDKVTLATDLSQEITLINKSIESFNQEVFNSILEPGRYSIPGFILFSDSNLLPILKKLGILSSVHYALEESLIDNCISILLVSTNHDKRLGIEINPDYASPVEANNCAMLMLRNQVVQDMVKNPKINWLKSLFSKESQFKICNIQLNLPTVQEIDLNFSFSEQRSQLINWILKLRSSDFMESLSIKFEKKAKGITCRSSEYTIPRSLCDNKVCMPIVKNKAKKSISFILPVVELFGVEKVIINIASYFKKLGWETCLVIFGRNDIEFTGQVQDTFDKFIFAGHTEIAKIKWSNDNRYEGSSLGSESNLKSKFLDFYSLIHFTDVAVFASTKMENALAAGLKKHNIITVNSLHVHDLTSLGRQFGPVLSVLPYEHAFDYLCPCSYDLGNWLRGSGIPPDKIIPVPNAPGFEIEQKVNNKLFEQRINRDVSKNLNILYMGRLDRQKGLHRLKKVYDQTRNIKNLNWRFIGKKVCGGQTNIFDKDFEAIIEPALHTPEELRDAYHWADIFILLSDWEGLPLSILEAMRQGVIVIATDVGANAEVISNSFNGFLFKKDTCIQQSIETLIRLSHNPNQVDLIRKNAYKDFSKRSWSESLTQLYKELTNILD